MTGQLVISFKLLSFWRVGTGGSEAAGFDAVCARDELNLPKIPGKQVRGLFREAVREWIEINGKTESVLKDLFGSRSLFGDDPSDESQPGTLRFSDARLPVSHRLGLQARPDLISLLFHSRRTTAILADRMVPRPHSLRLEEVAIPITLEAKVSPLGLAPDLWAKTLEFSAPLIRAIGAGRSRGLGRAVVSVGRVGL